MRSITAFFLLFSLFLLISSSLSDGRKEPADYWKSVMKEEAMPKAIEDLIHSSDPSSSFSNEKMIKGHTVPSESKFTKDFDTRPNVIIYHSHVHPESKEVKPVVYKEDLKQENDN